MEIALRVNVRYVAPPKAILQDSLDLFKSPEWVQMVARYILPELHGISPASEAFMNELKTQKKSNVQDDCVICMEPLSDHCALPCQHVFHKQCILPWLTSKSSCPSCRAQMPTDASTIYGVDGINTTLVLPENQSHIPLKELLQRRVGNEMIQSIVHVKMRRNANNLVEAQQCDSLHEHSSNMEEESELDTRSQLDGHARLEADNRSQMVERQNRRRRRNEVMATRQSKRTRT